MLTRRTATVTISAPDTSIARLVSLKSLYFPVPTISRERYLLPAMSRKSSTNLSSADEVDNLQRVAFPQQGGVIGVAIRHAPISTLYADSTPNYQPFGD